MLPRAAGVHVVNAIDNNVMVFSFTQGALLSSKNYTSEKTALPTHCPPAAQSPGRYQSGNGIAGMLAFASVNLRRMSECALCFHPDMSRPGHVSSVTLCLDLMTRVGQVRLGRLHFART